MPAPKLAYESGRHDALEANEQVLWEASPLPSNQARRHLIILVIAGVVIAGGFAIADSGVTALVMTGIYAFVASIWLGGDYHGEWTNGRKKYRITDRRISVLHPRKHLRMSVMTSELQGFVVQSDRRGTSLKVYGENTEVIFERPPELETALGPIVAFPQRLGRRFLLRRGQPFAAATPMPTMGHAMDEIQLQAGEVLLWSGRPRVWDSFDGFWWLNRLKMAAAAVIPAGIFGVSLYFAIINRSGAGPWFFACVGAFWLFGAVRGIVYEPFASAKRRRKTWYFVTSVRAIIEERDRQKKTRSIFLDMVNNVSISVGADGVGDIEIQQFNLRFERVENAVEVHRTLMDAVRAAGGPLPASAANQ